MARLETPCECKRMDRIERPSLLMYWEETNEHGRWQWSLWDQGKTLPAKGTVKLICSQPIELITFNVSIKL